MYLKSIEVQGFKSFANKITFDFHEGITGIVGPNGSGKSNVADAVRWVLGEQKVKSLRGSKMEDVIFAGTENRKALGFAYVAITLDNTDHSLAIDYDEVKVSRRLFRSGESEYMINGNISRLKDINELFYDTGIGQEGYSIIGQGQIDRILSGKAEERRELFDEAAGIVKYKRRKAATQKKLTEEQSNLIRVTDILNELEDRVKPLEHQAKKAKEYLQYKDELKKNDISMFLLNMTMVKDKLKDTNGKLQLVTDDYNDTEAEFKRTKEMYEGLEREIESIDLKTEEKKNEINKIQIFKEQSEGQVKVIQEQINSAKSNDALVKSRIDNIKKKNDILNTSITEYQEESKSIDESIADIKNQINKGYEELDKITESIADIMSESEDSKSEIIELLNHKSAVKSKIQRYDTMLEQISIRKAELNQKLIKFSSDKESQDKVIKELENNLKSIYEDIIEINKKKDSISEKLNESKNSLATLEKKSRELSMEYQKNTTRLESLKNITERYEGYGNSIKKVMELKENNKGIIGVVADIIKVEKKYEIAIETALGGSIQNIVTDSESTAKNSIEYLKKNKYGRATFLPLSSIANRTGFKNEEVFSEKGVLGLACDLVKTKNEYQAISKYLLGRVVVVDHIDNALVIARKYKYTIRMVTLEGELINPGGSMSGGAFKNSSNLLGRRREIEDFQNAIKENKIESEKCEKDIKDIRKKVLEDSEELNRLNEVLQQQFILQNTVKLNLNQANDKLKELTEGYEDFQRESSEIGIQITDIKDNNSELQSELETYEDLNAALEEKIGDLDSKLEVWKEKEIKKQDEINNIKLRLSEFSQQKTFVNENISRIQSEIEGNDNELKIMLDNSSNSENDVKAKEEEIESIKDAIQEAILSLEEHQKTIDELIKSKENQSNEHKDFFRKREELSDRISELDKEMFRLKSQIEKYEEQENDFIDYMWNEYELTYNMSKKLVDNEKLPSASELKKCITELKSKIRKLGDVNVNSIEEYKEVYERYSFLKNQHDDLVKAEKSLKGIINELDVGMRKQFSEKFEEIKVEFDKVFKELFGGGSGTIELSEEADVLDASISIISQPPGKKLQNMMQLSGGEKALTAISLLFAIQNLKPSPFCLLDEIEAALDDSNVSRYANYLHKLTEHTQFIVITHRKGTMEAADRLYGITMQEKGISTLVSVDLLDSQLTN